MKASLSCPILTGTWQYQACLWRRIRLVLLRTLAKRACIHQAKQVPFPALLGKAACCKCASRIEIDAVLGRKTESNRLCRNISGNFTCCSVSLQASRLPAFKSSCCMGAVASTLCALMLFLNPHFTLTDVALTAIKTHVHCLHHIFTHLYCCR